VSMNFAHRGFSAEYPENTMLAYRKAVEAGAHGIEMDVRLSADREIVISHDGKMDRMAGIHGHVRDFTLAELKQFNFAGEHTEVGFEPIATLAEYLDYIRTTNVVTNIEVKSDVGNFGELETKCVKLIRDFHLEDAIIFSSFNHYSMVYCKEIAPEIQTGLLFGTKYSEEFADMGFAPYAKFCKADYLHPHYTGMTPEDVVQAQKAGIGVNVWTVNDEETMKAYLAVNAHGIITNHPDMLHNLMK